MTQLLECPKKTRMDTLFDDSVGLMAVIAITPLRDLQLVMLRYLASHASSGTYLKMLDREIELAQRAETDPTEYSVFEKCDLESLQEFHDHITSNPDSSAPLTMLDRVLAEMLDMLQDPACATEHSDIESALASIGAEASPALCELITTAGPFRRKVLAINVLQTTYPYVPATTQAEIESAVDTASRQVTKSKKLAAALAELKTVIKATPTATTVGPAESTAPHLASSLEATSAI